MSGPFNKTQLNHDNHLIASYKMPLLVMKWYEPITIAETPILPAVEEI